MKRSLPILSAALLFASGCTGPGSVSSSPSSVVSGRVLRERAASVSRAGSGAVNSSLGLLYLGSDSSHHHFRNSGGSGGGDYVVPLAEVNIRNPYAYQPFQPRVRVLDNLVFAADNPYEILGGGAFANPNLYPGLTPARFDEYGRPINWPNFGIVAFDPTANPDYRSDPKLFGNGNLDGGQAVGGLVFTSPAMVDPPPKIDPKGLRRLVLDENGNYRVEEVPVNAPQAESRLPK